MSVTPYTKDSIKRALSEEINSYEVLAQEESVPRLLEIAALNLFMKSDVSSKNAKMIQQALLDLSSTGMLNYNS